MSCLKLHRWFQKSSKNIHNAYMVIYSLKVTYIKHYCHCMHDVCAYVLGAFLKPPMQLQTTRSPRLLNGFWYFFVQNKEEIFLVLFLFSTVHFCWVENDENFERSKKLFFAQVLFCTISKFLRPAAHELRRAICHKKLGIFENWDDKFFHVKTNN